MVVEYCELVEPNAWVEATVAAAAASGVGGAKSDDVHGFIESNGEVKAEADDNEGKLGNHDMEEEDDDKNARLFHCHCHQHH